ncbi:MAG: hypothetical protein JWP57_4367 [Spirosoma sp.]|nr:hypothetical protein [Spirosoma sp.]
MARIRSVHPWLWTDEAFVSVSPLARLLSIGILNECDDQGAFEWKPVTLRMRLLAADNVDVHALLDELKNVDLIRCYTIGPRAYGVCRDFQKWQRPKKPNALHPIPDDLLDYVGARDAGDGSADEEGPGSSPPVPPSSAPVPPAPRNPSSSGGEAVGNQSPTGGENAPQREEEGGKREEKEEGEKDSRAVRSGGRSRAAQADAEFAEFYAAYPHKVAPDAGLKAWQQVRTAGTPAAEIMAGLAVHKFSDDPKYIPHPATWLRQGRWKDRPALRVVPSAPRPAAARAGKLDWMTGGYDNTADDDFNGTTLEANAQ